MNKERYTSRFGLAERLKLHRFCNKEIELSSIDKEIDPQQENGVLEKKHEDANFRASSSRPNDRINR
jgi:hypothetical protein